MTTPTITWTDTLGTAVLACIVPAFAAWTPDTDDVCESVNPVTGAPLTYCFAYRQDHLINFDVPSIAASELPLALRLKSHLVKGNTAVVVEDDGTSYTVRIGPKTVPVVKLSDTTDLEYTLSLVVLVTS